MNPECVASFAFFIFQSLSILIGLRNCWVADQRLKIIWGYRGGSRISEYASYNEMMLRFWVMDIEKFRIVRRVA